jgi:phosphoribosylglycinamide formyltransferase 1
VQVKNIAVLASGGGTNFQAIIDAVNSGIIDGRVVCLIYNRKAAYAAERATASGIPAVYINRKTSISDDAFRKRIHDELLSRNADVVVLAGWLEILGAETVRRFQGSIINTHPALLPSFGGRGMYGHHVHEAVLAYGARVSGCTVHFVEEDVDTGPIISQQAVEVLPDDTADTLAARILPHEHRLLAEAVRMLCDDRLEIVDHRVFIK